MPKLFTTPDYQPTNFNILDYERYKQSESNLTHARYQLAEIEAPTRKELASILTDLIKYVEEHPDKEVRIFVSNPRDDQEYPLKRMAPILKKYLGEILTPEMIIEQINILISAYEDNRLEHDFYAVTELRLRYQSTVLKANETGRKLISGLSNFKDRLNEIEKNLRPYQQGVINKKKEFDSNLPEVVCRKYLHQALETALDNIYKEAHALAQKGNNEAAGIRGVCQELKKNPNRSLEKIVDGFNTLKQRSNDGYANKKLTAIQGILKAYHRNCQIIGEPNFNEETLEAISATIQNHSFMLNALLATATIGGLALAITAIIMLPPALGIGLCVTGAAVATFAVGTFFYRRYSDKKPEEEELPIANPQM